MKCKDSKLKKEIKNITKLVSLDLVIKSIIAC